MPKSKKNSTTKPIKTEMKVSLAFIQKEGIRWWLILSI
jgi:hypothetical protein